MKYAETCWTYGVRFCKSNVMSNGHLSCMFILVRRITYKKILQFSELQDFSLSFIRLLWSWRDSNPRPNAELMSFLHAYPQVGFRVSPGPWPPNGTLSSKFSAGGRGVDLPIPDLTAPPCRLVSGRRQSGDVSSAQLLRR